MLRAPSSVSRPAITSVSFSRRLTSVSARRLVSPGTWRTATSKLIAEISVAMRAAMSPESLATGLTSNLTPYSLNPTEEVPSAPATGIGSSPPATKRALPPDRQESLGSARITASPFCTSRLIIELSDEAIDRLVAKGEIRGAICSPEPSAAPPGRSALLRCTSPITWKLGPCIEAPHLTPMFSSISRRISMNFTSIAIIRSWPTFGSRLTTCG